MKATGQIQDALQWSLQEYEDYNLKLYWQWCQANANHLRAVQMLLSNAQINRWFWKELTTLQADFLKITKIISPNKIHLLRRLYQETTLEVLNHYPSALMKGLKKIKENEPFCLN